MRPPVAHAILASAAAVNLPALVRSETTTVWATPHDSYSSSVGVLGCKINTNRVAYWPGAVDCTNICISLSYDNRSVKLLRVDQSGGAYDVSYDAWNYLYTGKPARKSPVYGGAVTMQYENVDMSECRDLIDTQGGKLPLSASNSMNFLASCLEQSDSWVGSNYVLYNILDSVCSLGYNEACSLDWAAGANQATCENTLGLPVVLSGETVFNVQYGTGKLVNATSGLVVSDDDVENEGSGRRGSIPQLQILALLIGVWGLMIYPFVYL